MYMTYKEIPPAKMQEDDEYTKDYLSSLGWISVPASQSA